MRPQGAETLHAGHETAVCGYTDSRPAAGCDVVLEPRGEWSLDQLRLSDPELVTGYQKHAAIARTLST